MDGDQPFWVFAYGSLIWQPGFAYEEALPGRLHGWHRAMCILSFHYRGQPEAPGLVLGLDRGGSCRGLAYRVAGDQAETVREYLHQREMISGVYQPRLAPVNLADGRTVPGYVFITRRDHEQYAGRLALEQAAGLIRQGKGSRGSARDYLASTVAHLEALGLADHALTRLLQRVDDGQQR
jgi:glutathione-specific gamma-glutamylcyclotransferase